MRRLNPDARTDLSRAITSASRGTLEAECHELLRRPYEAALSYMGAALEFKDAAEIAAATGPPEWAAEKYLDAAQCFLNGDNSTEADRCIRLAMDVLEGQNGGARLTYVQGRMEQLQRELRAVVQEEIAIRRVIQGRKGGVRQVNPKFVEESLGRFPGLPLLHYCASIQALDRGDANLASQHAEIARRLQPWDARWWAGHAYVLLQSGSPDEGLRVAKDAVVWFPTDPRLRTIAGVCAYDSSRKKRTPVALEEARRLLAEAMKPDAVDSADTLRLLIMRADTEYRLRNLAQATRSIEQAQLILDQNPRLGQSAEFRALRDQLPGARRRLARAGSHRPRPEVGLWSADVIAAIRPRVRIA